MRACPKCERTYPDETDFCPRDGSPLAPVQASSTEAHLAAGLARSYRIVRRLGAGGMGAVFLAEQIALGNRPVAVKILLRKLLDDPEFLQRFHNEATSTARIRHPNVITVHECGQSDDGSPYIAMEYLEGETLHQTLKRRGALPVAETVEIVRQVARGLNAAHKLDIVHRDIKPDNIFLARTDDTGEETVLPGVIVKVMDFGIARLLESTHTMHGAVIGTPAYMSFEQAWGMTGEELDARSDIYSLGVVVYEMLTGRVPFHSDTPNGFARKHMMEEPPPFRAVAPSLRINPEIERVVMKALCKQREERQSSALEFARELAAVAKDEMLVGVQQTYKPTVISSHAAAAPNPWPSSARRESGVAVLTPPPLPSQAEIPRPEVVLPLPPRKRSVAMWAVLGVALVLTIGGGVWYYLPKPVPPNPQPTPAPAAVATPSSVPPGMVLIPSGTFTMGRNNAPDLGEKPAHKVTVEGFYLDVLPQSQSDNMPITSISWYDAQQKCRETGKRLPTEAEWEFAARGTDGRLYPWGDTFDTSATNSKEAGKGGKIPVGVLTRNKSPFGVLDMSGNVWEWTNDDYEPYPGGKAAFKIPSDAKFKVIRGGSFEADKLHVTATTRNLERASGRSPIIGFRCAKAP